MIKIKKKIVVMLFSVLVLRCNAHNTENIAPNQNNNNQSGYNVGSHGGLSVNEIYRSKIAWTGEPIVYLKDKNAEIVIKKITINAGVDTGWHMHDVPELVIVEQGKLEVETKDGQKRIFSKGDIISQNMNIWHHGHNIGTKPVKLLQILLSTEGKKLTIH